jgi:TRAP-type C4-dicarboxylate transport system permease small subunit
MSQSGAEHESLGLLQDPRLQKYITLVFRGLLYAGMFFVVAMMLITVVHGVGRYALDRPVPGLIDISSVMLVSSVALIIAYTQVVRGHVTIGTIVDRLSPKKQKIIDIFNYLVSIVMILILIWQSITRGIYLMDEGSASAILGIPDFPFLFVLALGWVLFGLAIIMHVVNFVLGGREK